MLTRRSFLKKSALASMFSMLPISMIPNEVPIDWKWNQTNYWSLEEPLMKLAKQVMRLTKWDDDICNEYRTKLINLYAQVKIDTDKVTKSNRKSCEITFNTKNKTIQSNDILTNDLISIGWDWKRIYIQPLSKTFKLEGKDNEADNLIENLDYWYKNYQFPFGKLKESHTSIPYWNLEEWKHI
jgi:hypothetical protein